MNNLNHKFIFIGSSTGGPSLLEKIVASLPTRVNATIVLAQHMQRVPLVSFAKRLDRISKIDVILVDKKTVLESSKVYILYDSAQVIQEKNRAYLDMVKEDAFYHPSIDILFSSAKILKSEELYFYILTGIGRDGVDALKLVEHCATRRIAQDQNSSAVYGMPRAAYEEGCIDEVKSIDEIIDEILRIV